MSRSQKPAAAETNCCHRIRTHADIRKLPAALAAAGHHHPMTTARSRRARSIVAQQDAMIADMRDQLRRTLSSPARRRFRSDGSRRCHAAFMMLQVRSPAHAHDAESPGIGDPGPRWRLRSISGVARSCSSTRPGELRPTPALLVFMPGGAAEDGSEELESKYCQPARTSRRGHSGAQRRRSASGPCRSR